MVAVTSGTFLIIRAVIFILKAVFVLFSPSSPVVDADHFPAPWRRLSEFNLSMLWLHCYPRSMLWNVIREC
jgi:hypothetical protein